jgi:hypothetical protein
LKKERLPSVDLLQRGRARAGAEWGGSGMQRKRKWAPTILHNVFTCCHLHTLCNNGDVAQNHKERLLRLVGKMGLLRPRDLQSAGIPRVYLAKLVEQGELLKTGRGLYVQGNSPLTENHPPAAEHFRAG